MRGDPSATWHRGVRTLLSKITEATRTEPGNICFIPYQQLEGDLEVIVLERSVSQRAFAAHQQDAALQGHRHRPDHSAAGRAHPRDLRRRRLARRRELREAETGESRTRRSK
ncbi:putative quinol monooxygenase [Planotetraspora mira]